MAMKRQPGRPIPAYGLWTETADGTERGENGQPARPDGGGYLGRLELSADQRRRLEELDRELREIYDRHAQRDHADRVIEPPRSRHDC